MKSQKRTVDLNTTTLMFPDYFVVRNAKIGDIVTLSDGNEYEVVNNKTNFGGSANMSMDIIPYGGNNTADNW